jgi:hypothetical protein
MNIQALFGLSVFMSFVAFGLVTPSGLGFLVPDPRPAILDHPSVRPLF